MSNIDEKKKVVSYGGDIGSSSNVVPPPAANPIEEEVAQVQRRLEEKEAEVAYLRARMVCLSIQAQQVAGQTSTSGWPDPNKNNLYHFILFYFILSQQREKANCREKNKHKNNILHLIYLLRWV